MAALKVTRKNDGSVSYGIQVRIKPFKPVYESFPTKKEALDWAGALTKQLRAQRSQGNTQPTLATMTLAELNAAYLNDPETRRLTDFEGVERMINWWTARDGARRVIEFGVLQIRAARAALMLKHEPATVNRYLAWQRAAWNWALNAGYGLVKPWPKGIMLTEPKARVRYLSDAELAAVFAAAQAHSPVMYAALTLALAAGPRAGEMLRLRWQDIDVPNAAARFLRTKSDAPRSVHLPPAALAALLAIKPAEAPDSALVFMESPDQPLDYQRMDGRWQTIRTAAKLEDFRWHDLRHTCASLLAQNGANLLEIGSVLGHTNPTTTLKYTHLIAGKAVTGHAGLNAKLAAAGGAS